MQLVTVLSSCLVFSVPGLASKSVRKTPLATCTSDLDCSLNGVCSDGICTCDAPWHGPRCGLLAFAKAAPAAGKGLYPVNDTAHNTWNGPMVGPIAGVYYMYLPLYPREDNLYHPTSTLLGTAPSRYGPWSWQNLTSIPPTINPGALAFKDPKTGVWTFSIWVFKDFIYTSTSPAGPFTPVAGSDNRGECDINASPMFYKGAFFCTGSKGTQIFTASALAGPWTVYTNITERDGEDPFLFVDKRGNWHAMYHSANGSQLVNCGSSRVSWHSFSADDGVTWKALDPPVYPYSPTVTWDDNTTVSYTSMERPHAYFDNQGVMTHLTVAGAGLDYGDKGCATIPDCFPGRQQGHCPCCNCKYRAHDVTLLIELDYM